MKVIGLTGSIASGKTTVSKWFIEEGIPVIDADFVYKELSKPKNILYNTLVEAFGTSILREDDSINWQKFSKMIFTNEAMRKKLNSLTHPIVKQEVIKQLSLYKDQNTEFVVLMVPLLFESDFYLLCGQTICVYVNQQTHIKRLMERDHITKTDAIIKIKAQMSLEKKKKLATYSIDNSLDLGKTREEFNKIIQILRSE
ncbi:MAG: dephospho-CoA kinase [Bacilli bacterium]|nr:dephospho-CoA kinase [Bacilli bacterium]